MVSSKVFSWKLSSSRPRVAPAWSDGNEGPNHVSGGHDWGYRSHDMIACDGGSVCLCFPVLAQGGTTPSTPPTASERLNHFLKTLLEGIGRIFIIF